MTQKHDYADFAARATRVLATTFLGMHHVGKVYKKGEDGNWPMWETSSYPLATWDFDQLTRLVISAHEECIRVEVGPSGPRMVKVRLWPRTREGGVCERHPTIEEAIAKLRASKRES